MTACTPGQAAADDQAAALARVTTALAARQLADVTANSAEAAFRAAICAALDSGVSPTRLAEAAGISRRRIYQIRDNTR